MVLPKLREQTNETPPKIEGNEVAMNPVQGQIIATCGHEITIEETETGSGCLVEHDGDSLGISYGVYCPKCLKERAKEFAEGKQMAESPTFSSICSQPKYLELTPDEAKLMMLLIGWSSSIWQNPSSIVVKGNRVKGQDVQKLSGKLLAFLQAQES